MWPMNSHYIYIYKDQQRGQGTGGDLRESGMATCSSLGGRWKVGQQLKLCQWREMVVDSSMFSALQPDNGLRK